MVKNCLNCGKDFEQPKNRREKKFCGDGCRASYNQKTVNPSLSFVEEPGGRWTLPDGKSGNFYFKYGVNKGKELSEVVAENNKPVNKKNIEETRNPTPVIPQTEDASKISELESKIAAKEAELEKCGSGSLGAQLKNSINRQISSLKKELYSLKYKP